MRIASKEVGLKVYSGSDVPAYHQIWQNYNMKAAGKSFQMFGKSTSGLKLYSCRNKSRLSFGYT